MIHIPYFDRLEELRHREDRPPPRAPRPRLERPALASKVILDPRNVIIRVHPGRDRTRVLEEIRAPNLVVAAGRDIIASLLADQAYAPSAIALGTDASPTTDSMIALGSEVFRDVISARFVSGSICTLEMFVDQDQANGYVLREAALFGGQTWINGVVAPGGGTMFNRVVHQAVTKNDAVSLTYTVELPISSG